MAEEVGIVMTLYDRVSPTLRAIAGSNAAFNKDLDELEESLKALLSLVKERIAQ